MKLSEMTMQQVKEYCSTKKCCECEIKNYCPRFLECAACYWDIDVEVDHGTDRP